MVWVNRGVAVGVALIKLTYLAMTGSVLKEQLVTVMFSINSYHLNQEFCVLANNTVSAKTCFK